MNIFWTNTTLKWDKLLFGLLHSASTNKKTKYSLEIVIIADRNAITRKWFKPDTPFIEDWYDIVNEVFVMKRINFSLRLQEITFEEI